GFSHTGDMQYAYDFDMEEGGEIRASKDGVVASGTVSSFTACGNKEYSNYGNRVVLNHGDGTATLYLHLQSVSVSIGSSIRQGDKVGVSGKTGWTSCDPHLHFQRQAQGIWFTK